MKYEKAVGSRESINGAEALDKVLTPVSQGSTVSASDSNCISSRYSLIRPRVILLSAMLACSGHYSGFFCS